MKAEGLLHGFVQRSLFWMKTLPAQITRVKIDKMHKGVFGENVQNSKSNTKNAQSRHGTGCAAKAGA